MYLQWSAHAIGSDSARKRAVSGSYSYEAARRWARNGGQPAAEEGPWRSQSSLLMVPAVNIAFIGSIIYKFSCYIIVTLSGQ